MASEQCLLTTKLGLLSRRLFMCFPREYDYWALIFWLLKFPPAPVGLLEVDSKNSPDRLPPSGAPPLAGYLRSPSPGWHASRA